MKLRKEIKEKFRTDEKKMEFALKVGKSYATVVRWFRDDDESLTLKKSIKAICEILEIDEDKIFEEE